ncbi:predicted protein [Sclerotinia sclerotiorum 1980 UF-70]|uniref:Uncharacterized protein n=2 Tax=Sclerotinia sclerotiorum (strain ATCC 18683 / 1980 / Ss-1) TaxID=665079 RepID=A7EJ86_SCLS1|nr:predicted protein [Sclerotinia sclerotiorum 1980 UF-70]APA11864.1 hypothetical protein sscle_08g066340 [Sclerotinia sclerotiorum 1980 UF-70]EDO02902.1 predicted protein [Sclerotinia sclerotiorum 1980 UF-70]
MATERKKSSVIDGLYTDEEEIRQPKPGTGKGSGNNKSRTSDGKVQDSHKVEQEIDQSSSNQ